MGDACGIDCNTDAQNDGAYPKGVEGILEKGPPRPPTSFSGDGLIVAHCGRGRGLGAGRAGPGHPADAEPDAAETDRVGALLPGLSDADAAAAPQPARGRRHRVAVGHRAVVQRDEAAGGHADRRAAVLPRAREGAEGLHVRGHRGRRREQGRHLGVRPRLCRRRQRAGDPRADVREEPRQGRRRHAGHAARSRGVSAVCRRGRGDEVRRLDGAARQGQGDRTGRVGDRHRVTFPPCLHRRRGQAFGTAQLPDEGLPPLRLHCRGPGHRGHSVRLQAVLPSSREAHFPAHARRRLDIRRGDPDPCREDRHSHSRSAGQLARGRRIENVPRAGLYRDGRGYADHSIELYPGILGRAFDTT